jgi:hypothetical protein
MPSISLAVSGQTSEAYEVGPGARVTATGSGYVEWTSGTLTDVRNGAATWSTWPKGASTGYADTLRRVLIRGVATGALTVTWDEGERDEGPDDAYWQEQVPAWSLDSSGNVQGLVGPDGVVLDQVARPARWVDVEDIGVLYSVTDISPIPVLVKMTGWGKRILHSFPLIGISEDHTHLDNDTRVSIPWSSTLPAGVFQRGWLEVYPLVTFPNSATSKTIQITVNGTSIFNKTRTTATHESPLIVINARDMTTMNTPYSVNSVYISPGTSWVSTNYSPAHETDPVTVDLLVSFPGGADTGEVITTRLMRAIFNPY